MGKLGKNAQQGGGSEKIHKVPKFTLGNFWGQKGLKTLIRPYIFRKFFTKFPSSEKGGGQDSSHCSQVHKVSNLHRGTYSVYLIQNESLDLHWKMDIGLEPVLVVDLHSFSDTYSRHLFWRRYTEYTEIGVDSDQQLLLLHVLQHLFPKLPLQHGFRNHRHPQVIVR